MSRVNPKLIILAGAMLAATLAFKVIPLLVTAYAELRSDRENLQQELTYYQKLVEDEAELKSRAEGCWAK